MQDIVPALLTNTIYNKRIPGIGATTLEILSLRNSILVLPYIPVIEGKCLDEHGNLRKDIIGVYGYMNREQLSEYLEQRGDRINKILCTPEKFQMVLDCIRGNGENPYTDYFLLLDESETIIKDVDYRPNIKLPMKDFFLFKDKAMISATPITPRDPRFEDQGFKYVKIVPHKNRKFKVNLELLGTNNVASVLREYIQNHPKETLCIFTNCSKTITKTINDLQLHEEAKVFCAERLLIKRFRYTKIKNAYTSLKDSKDGLAKVNFLTSRFFCAVDMIYPDIKPHIIMVTNLYYSDHSKIDPATDAIQISGRFRKGIKKMVHISNFNPDIPFKTYGEFKKVEDEALLLYQMLENHKKLQPGNEARVAAVNKVLEDPSFAQIITDGALDIYLADNRLQRGLVTLHYSHYDRLKSIYQKTGYFKVGGFYKTRLVTDEDIMKKDAVAGNERRKAIAEALHAFYTLNGPFNLDLSFYKELHEFYYMDEVIYTAYFDLGIDFLRSANFKLKSIKRALLNCKKDEFKVSGPVTGAVYIEFVSNQTVTNSEAKEKLQEIYDKYADSRIVAYGTDIKLYFETTEIHSIPRKNGIQRGYRLVQKKHSDVKLTDRNAHIKQN